MHSRTVARPNVYRDISSCPPHCLTSRSELLFLSCDDSAFLTFTRGGFSLHVRLPLFCDHSSPAPWMLAQCRIESALWSLAPSKCVVVSTTWGDTVFIHVWGRASDYRPCLRENSKFVSLKRIEEIKRFLFSPCRFDGSQKAFVNREMLSDNI